MFRKIVAVIKKGDRIGVEGLDADHFARGLNFYKLFWVFVMGSLVGFVVETVWAIVTEGCFRWKSGIILIPLNPVYGLSAIVLYSILFKFKKKSFLSLFAVFLIGSVSCSAIEYLISFLQEKTLGSISWDYSDRALRIGTRICLEFTIYWGILAVAWVMVIRPLLDLLILKIPSNVGKPLSIVLFAVLVVFGTVSMFALYRWGGRLHGTAGNLGSFGKFVDRVFNDKVMEYFYPNMVFV